MPDVQVRDLAVPASPEDISDEFRAWAELQRTIRADFFGTRDNAFSDEATRVSWLSSELRTQVVAAATVEGRIVGGYTISLPHLENQHMAWVNVRVAPTERGRGYGTALAAALLERVAGLGRSILIVSTFHPAGADGGERIAPVSGDGSIPADDPSVRFAIRHGFELGLVNGASVSLIRDVDLAALRTSAEARAADGYRLVQWHGPTPAHLRDEMANLYNRMSADEPTGGLDMEQSTLSADDIVLKEQESAEEGLEQWVTAVDFSGTLVAFTVLYSDEESPTVADQEETLVFAEHRGRGLGTLVKAANAQYLLEHRPAIERFITWNAAQNAPMLAINAAVGFRPLSLSGNWQRRI